MWPRSGWVAEHFDSRGATLGSVAIVLPSEDLVQPLFARMRAELDRKTAHPERHCRHIPEPTPEELMEQQVHYGTRIFRPDLESIEPVEVLKTPD